LATRVPSLLVILVLVCLIYIDALTTDYRDAPFLEMVSKLDILVIAEPLVPASPRRGLI